MPRLTDDAFYNRYRDLHYAWIRFQRVFEVLSAEQLAAIFACYLPSKYLVKSELMVHRRILAEKEPGLISKAGKAYAQVDRAFRASLKDSNGSMDCFHRNLDQYIDKGTPTSVLISPKPGKVKGVSIRVEHREKVDWDRYAYSLLQHVKNEMVREAPEKKSS